MKKALTIISLLFVISGCAHHDNNVAVDHHHHEQKEASFDGKCAYSVAHEELNVAGKPEYNFKHKGMTYYFSSEEKMNEFKKDIDKNVQKARKAWEVRGKY